MPRIHTHTYVHTCVSFSTSSDTVKGYLAKGCPGTLHLDYRDVYVLKRCVLILAF